MPSPKKALRLLSEIDKTRAEISANTSREKKAALGQFLTPASIARFMASLFYPSRHTECRLLDAGAGIGSLSAAFLERISNGELGFHSIQVDAFELDSRLHPVLARVLGQFSSIANLTTNVIGGDFILSGSNIVAGDIFSAGTKRYTHAILNPPYKKIHCGSPQRIALEKIGIQIVNLYAAFVALALELLEDDGQLVAIIPRSFCNGQYYKPFREFVLSHGAIMHLHLFNARDKAFRDDKVLQENVIILIRKNGESKSVVISNSSDDTFEDYACRVCLIDEIVHENDREKFIRIPTHASPDLLDGSHQIRTSLGELGIAVSTGPVVDFRVREYIRDQPQAGTVPLLYPGHFSGTRVDWPKQNFRKPNAIIKNGITERWLLPNDFYVVTRRFSSKEEKRRIVASIVDPAAFPSAGSLGFENHLNIFHCHGRGLSQEIAWGLVTFLNTTVLDTHFRHFSGHTQVNATDLRHIKYPDRDTLIRLGKWAKNHPQLTQSDIDAEVEHLLR